MQFGDVICGRFSCKVYDGRQISDEQLAAILEAGRAAPTAKNFQPQRIYVVQSEEGLAKLDGFTPCRYGAPTVLVVAYGRGAVLTYPDGAAGCRRASSGLVLQKGPASPGGFAGPLRCGPVSGAGARPRACRAGAGRGRRARDALFGGLGADLVDAFDGVFGPGGRVGPLKSTVVQPCAGAASAG